MSKIITTDQTDIELDPESLTENSTALSKSQLQQAISELDDILLELDSNSKEKNHAVANKSNYIRFQTKLNFSTFHMNFILAGLNQTIHDRRSIEVTLEADESKLLQLFSFYQKHICKQKTSSRKLRVGQYISRRNKVTKNDVYVTKLHVPAKDKKTKLIDTKILSWRVTEMRYTTAENHIPKIVVILVRTK